MRKKIILLLVFLSILVFSQSSFALSIIGYSDGSLTTVTSSTRNLAMTSDGVYHAVWLNGNIIYANSSTPTNNWNGNITIPLATGATDVQYPSILTDYTNRIHIFSIQNQWPTGGWGLFYTNSSNYVTFGTQKSILNESGGGAVQAACTEVLDSSNNIHAFCGGAYYSGTNQALWNLTYVNSTNNGTSFSTAVELTSTNYFTYPSAIVDSSSNLYVFGFNSSGILYINRTNGVWGTMINITSNGTYPNPVIDDNDNIYVTYADTVGNKVMALNSSDKTTWTISKVNTTKSVTGGITSAIRTTNSTILSFFTGRILNINNAGDVFSVNSTNNASTWSNARDMAKEGGTCYTEPSTMWSRYPSTSILQSSFDYMFLNCSNSAILFGRDILYNVNIAPTLSSSWESPTDGSTYVNGQTLRFNITVCDANLVANIDKVLFEWNGGANITVTEKVNWNTTCDNYTATKVDLGVGTYNYKWFANDTSNAWANVISDSYTINKAILTGTISSPDVNYPADMDISGIEGNAGDSDVIYQTCINNECKSGVGVNSFDYGAGSYTCKFNTTGATFENYTSSANLQSDTCVINKGTITGTISSPDVTFPNDLSLTGSESLVGDTDVVYQTCVGNICITGKGANTFDMGGGTYNCIFNTTGATFTNWTANGNIQTDSCVVNKATLVGTVTGNDVTYPTGVTETPAETNTGDADVEYRFYRDITLFSSATGSAPTADTTVMGVGSYTWKLNTTGTTFANYSTSASIASDTSNVGKGALSGTLSSPDVTYPTIITATGSESNGGDTDVVYQTCCGTSCISGKGPNTFDYSASTYTCVFNTTGATFTNYTANANLQTDASVIVSKGALSGTISSPDVTYPNDISATGSETNAGDTDVVYQTCCGNSCISGKGPNTFDLGGGTYSCVFNTTSATFTNYTANANLQTDSGVIVGLASRTCTLATDKLWTRIFDNTASSTTCTVDLGSTDGSMTFTRNSASKTSPDSVTNVGTYNYACQWTGGSNYSDCTQQTNTLIINKITPLFSTSVTTPIIYGTASDYSALESNPGDTGCVYTLLRNGTSLGTGSSLTDTTVLGAGIYNYTYYTDGCTNYDSGRDEKILTVSKASTSTTNFLNGSTTDRSYNFNAPINVTGYVNTPTLTVHLSMNKTGFMEDFASGSGKIQNITLASILGFGTYNVTSFFPGNENYSVSSTTTYLTVINNGPPTYSEIKYSPLPTNYATGNTFQFNSTWNDVVGISMVVFEWNGTSNTTITTHSGNEYYYSFGDLKAGNYTYRWLANNTANEWSTYSGTYQVAKAISGIDVYLNGVKNSNIFATNNSILNITSTLNATGQTITLNGNYTYSFIPNSSVNSITNTTTLMNFTNQVWNFTAYFPANENFTSSSRTQYLVLDVTTPIVYNFSIEKNYIDINSSVLFSANISDNEIDKVLVEINSSGGLNNHTAVYNPTSKNYEFTLNKTWLGENAINASEIFLTNLFVNDTAGNSQKNSTGLSFTYAMTELYDYGDAPDPCTNGIGQSILLWTKWNQTNGVAINDGTCEAMVNSIIYPMSFNSLNNRFERSVSTAGTLSNTYTYNITCYNSTWQNATGSGTFVVNVGGSGTTPPGGGGSNPPIEVQPRGGNVSFKIIPQNSVWLAVKGKDFQKEFLVCNQYNQEIKVSLSFTGEYKDFARVSYTKIQNSDEKSNETSVTIPPSICIVFGVNFFIPDIMPNNNYDIGLIFTDSISNHQEIGKTTLAVSSFNILPFIIDKMSWKLNINNDFTSKIQSTPDGLNIRGSTNISLQYFGAIASTGVLVSFYNIPRAVQWFKQRKFLRFLIGAIFMGIFVWFIIP